MKEMYLVTLSGEDERGESIQEQFLTEKTPFVELLATPEINYSMMTGSEPIYLTSTEMREVEVEATPVTEQELAVLLKLKVINGIGFYSERIMEAIRRKVGKLAFVETEQNSYFCFLRYGFDSKEIEDLDFMTDQLDIPDDDKVLAILEMDYSEDIDLGERLILQY